MIALLTDTLLYGILAFFLLGVVTYLTFSVLSVIFDVCFSAPSTLYGWRRTKRNTIRSYFEAIRSRSAAPVSVDVACAVTITLIGLLYCLFTYVFLDGVLRLLPFIALLFGVYLLNLTLGNKFKLLNKYIGFIFMLILGYPFYFGIILARFCCTLIDKVRSVLLKKGIKNKNN